MAKDKLNNLIDQMYERLIQQKRMTYKIQALYNEVKKDYKKSLASALDRCVQEEGRRESEHV